MHINCGHCGNALEIVIDGAQDTQTCPSCGSQLELDLGLATETFDIGQRSIGRYTLHDHLGRGHFGDVWRGKDTELDRWVAIKIPRSQELDDTSRALIVREARAAAQLQHENIVRVIEVFEEQGRLCIVSELIDGVTLADAMSAKQFTTNESVRLLSKVARALHHAHEQGIIHRDLKPGNMMLQSDGEPKLVDFGLAKRDGGEITMTVTGVILGTPAYMPPEQARGDGHNADRRSDVYSLGVVLYEMLTGKRPFDGSRRMLLHQVLHDDARPPRRFNSQIPRDLENVVLKAIDKDPERRYQTSEELADDLDRFLDNRPVLARRTPVWVRGWKLLRRNPLASGSLAITFVALVVLAVVLATRSGPAQTAGGEGDRQGRTEIPEDLRRVEMVTEPANANLVFIPLSTKNGRPMPEQASDAVVSPAPVSLKPGDYLVVAYSDDHRQFHEVYRRVPDDEQTIPGANRHLRWTRKEDLIELPLVKLFDQEAVTREMVRIDGQKAFQLGSDDPINLAHKRDIPTFYIDPTEVTVDQFLEVRGVLPSHFPKDTPTGTYPLTRVSQHDAIQLAETLGKRLPTEFEYEFAATVKGTRKFPWGDDENQMVGWELQKVKQVADFFGSTEDIRVWGMYSNALEWTASWPNAHPRNLTSAGTPPSAERVIRGGPPESMFEDWKNKGSRLRGLLSPPSSVDPSVGLRCYRSPKPRLDPTDFESVVK